MPIRPAEPVFRLCDAFEATQLLPVNISSACPWPTMPFVCVEGRHNGEVEYANLSSRLLSSKGQLRPDAFCFWSVRLPATLKALVSDSEQPPLFCRLCLDAEMIRYPGRSRPHPFRAPVALTSQRRKHAVDPREHWSEARVGCSREARWWWWSRRRLYPFTGVATRETRVSIFSRPQLHPQEQRARNKSLPHKY